MRFVNCKRHQLTSSADRKGDCKACHAEHQLRWTAAHKERAKEVKERCLSKDGVVQRYLKRNAIYKKGKTLKGICRHCSKPALVVNGRFTTRCKEHWEVEFDRTGKDRLMRIIKFRRTP